MMLSRGLPADAGHLGEQEPESEEQVVADLRQPDLACFELATAKLGNPH